MRLAADLLFQLMISGIGRAVDGLDFKKKITKGRIEYE